MCPPPSESLYDRLGGVEAVRAVVNDFYERLIADDKLSIFFDGVKVPALKIHQLEFLKIAFTDIPEDLDVVALMIEKHKALFRDKGLNGEHFDLVAGHLVGTCKDLGVADELIDEAVAIVVPLRIAFEQGAEMYGGTRTEEETKDEGPDSLHQGTLLSKLGGSDAIKATVEEMYKRLVDDPETAVFFEEINMAFLKQHQLDFMKIAFTVIPDDLDVPGLLKEKHSSLFKKGLNEKHFDIVAKHFVGAMNHLNVPQELIDEAVSIIGPLRVVFEEGAETA
ncbi:hypothetical protein FisN_4Hu248 [Fistulifera solaris]|uniref:Globin family profile domain-containing protein n=1 Tax=Fistulifera solaris TaxID=1519565 RepID=A0A1Z5KED1_FISSO|nr:hypothetical protein FisN_4Hu248 [Fistulifera solaris]|eukprot:GAX24690.1 hypothetical protein FisN_4Hu248 [Fistulifera solaris]